MIQHFGSNIFLLRQGMDGFGTLLGNVVVQPLFQFGSTISLLFPGHEIIAIIIHIFLNKTVYQFGFASQFGILNHRVNNGLTAFGIICTIWVKICNEFKDVCHIDNVAMQKLQTKIDVFQTSIRILSTLFVI